MSLSDSDLYLKVQKEAQKQFLKKQFLAYASAPGRIQFWSASARGKIELVGEDSIKPKRGKLASDINKIINKNNHG